MRRDAYADALDCIHHMRFHHEPTDDEMKRAKAILDTFCTFVRMMGNDEEDNGAPPPWSEAPDWATHRVQNPDGWWHWCGHRDSAYPVLSRSCNAWVMQARPRFQRAKKCAPNPDWQLSCEARPNTV